MGLYESLRIDESGIGQVYGKTTQIGASFSARTDDKQRQKYRYAIFECECGNVRLLKVASVNGGKPHRCQKCKARKHGKYYSPEYGAWRALIQRCTNPKVTHYHNYGGRGIKVCERWRESFENFYQDMGPRPTAKHEIDRIDNDGNYEPGNCRWLLKKLNNRNRRNNHLVTYRGETMTVTDLAEKYGKPYQLVSKRLWIGWSVEDALNRPLKRILPSSVFASSPPQ